MASRVSKVVGCSRISCMFLQAREAYRRTICLVAFRGCAGSDGDSQHIAQLFQHTVGVVMFVRRCIVRDPNEHRIVVAYFLQQHINTNLGV
jgi:hypothetical protein